MQGCRIHPSRAASPIVNPPVPAWTATPAPPVLVVSSCIWTGRTIEHALLAAGFTPIRATSADGAERLCTCGAIEAVIVDERDLRPSPGDADLGEHALLRATRHMTGVPLLLLVPEASASAPLADTFAAGVWGLVPFPLGAPWWLHQLAVWIAAGRRSRERIDSTIVDATTGIYNARGLMLRAQEIEGELRRRGGGIAAAVFDVHAADAPALGRAGHGLAIDHGELAVTVALASRRAKRAADAVAFIGDGDFALLAPHADADGVRALVRRVADAVETERGCRVEARVGAFSVGEISESTVTVADMIASPTTVTSVPQNRAPLS
jgi:GGDEF domain-containing protein